METVLLIWIMEHFIGILYLKAGFLLINFTKTEAFYAIQVTALSEVVQNFRYFQISVRMIL